MQSRGKSMKTRLTSMVVRNKWASKKVSNIKPVTDDECLEGMHDVAKKETIMIIVDDSRWHRPRL